MDTTTPFAAHHIVITVEVPALSEYIAYLKDEHNTHLQKKIDEMAKDVAKLTDQLKASGIALATSETQLSQLHIG
jgi:hypothetical protein